MKIRINQDIVEFTPENPAEKTELEALWIKMANCIGKTYIPSEDKTATFHIEGLSKEETGAVPSVRAPYDTDVYCQTCNKTVHVKKGEVIPFCCGRLMEILD